MAKELVDLKRRREDPEDKEYFKAPTEPPKDYYPISMWLGKAEVDALGLASANIGDEHMMTLKVRVTGKSSNESEDGWNDKNVTLTVLEGKIGDKGKDPDEVAAKLYDNKETD